MLQLTRLNGPLFALNPDLIERAESTPDTVITLVNGSKYVVLETLDQLIELIHAYRVELVSAAQASGGFAPAGRPGAESAARHPARRDAGAAPKIATAKAATAKVVALHPGEE